MSNTTPFTSFFPYMRCILGDRLSGGSYAYQDADLQSAIVTAVMFGQAPPCINLDNPTAPQSATAVTTPANGDQLAWLVYAAVLYLIRGEDGAISYRTRSLSVNDKGDRKRDLMNRFEYEIYKIKDGNAVFTTYQSFIAFVGAFQKAGQELPPFGEFTGIDVRSTPGTITV
jgi:hypothetical protein